MVSNQILGPLQWHIYSCCLLWLVRKIKELSLQEKKVPYLLVFYAENCNANAQPSVFTGKFHWLKTPIFTPVKVMGSL